MIFICVVRLLCLTRKIIGFFYWTSLHNESIELVPLNTKILLCFLLIPYLISQGFSKTILRGGSLGLAKCPCWQETISFSYLGRSRKEPPIERHWFKSYSTALYTDIMSFKTFSMYSQYYEDFIKGFFLGLEW